MLYCHCEINITYIIVISVVKLFTANDGTLCFIIKLNIVKSIGQYRGNQS